MPDQPSQAPQPEAANQAENTAEAPEKSQEELEAEEAAKEAARPSEAAKKSDKDRTERIIRSDDEELVLNWLLKNDIQSLDADLFDHFKNALDEKFGDKEDTGNENPLDSENLNEVAEFLVKLPKIFEKVDTRINELVGKENYEKIKDKRIDIIKGFCTPVLNGRLSSEDVSALAEGIEIVSKTNPPEDMEAEVKKQLQESGYDAVMYFQKKTNKIIIFEETLVDKFPGFDHLDLKHMMSHEMSHGIVEKTLKYNKKLCDKTFEIVNDAESIKDSQSNHIKNMLEQVANAESDFAASFEKIRTSGEFTSLPPEQQAVVEKNAMDKFISDRKKIAAVEILTEYTAMYLQSDGKFDSFVENCIEKSDSEALESYLGLTQSEVKKINEAKDPEKKETLIEELKSNNPKFKKLVEIYNSFYKSIHKNITSNKGSFAEIGQGDDDEENPLSSGYGSGSGYGYTDSASGFGSREGQDKNNKSNGGFWKEVGALIKAIGNEVDIGKSAGI